MFDCLLLQRKKETDEQEGACFRVQYEIFVMRCQQNVNRNNFKALNGTIRHTQCALNGTLWVQVIHTLSLAGLFNFFNFILKQIAV